VSGKRLSVNIFRNEGKIGSGPVECSRMMTETFLNESEEHGERKVDVLVIYQLCSFGGVERAILNRARTFRKYQQNVKISVGYLHDYGALASFQAYIHANQLDDCLSAFLIDEDAFPDLDQYHVVLNIDTPQIFERTLHAGNLFVECHTPTVKNRQYLGALPENIRGILVPSEAFKSILAGEFQQLPPIFVMPNPVTQDFFDLPFSAEERIYFAAPLAYLARVDDELKNFSEAADIFELFANDENMMFAVVGRGAEAADLLGDLEKRGIIGKTFLRNQMDFDAVPGFVGMIKNHRGVFISPSKGESFGLSAAEFMSAGVPVLLSDIAPHQELVNGDERFIYPLGDIYSAREKIIKILDHWEEASKSMVSYSQKFNGLSFMTAWQEFLDAQRQ
jgi:glycosyltransferase involved in cell wall biosynthesis